MSFEGYIEVHSEPCHTSKMEHFAKVVNALSLYLFLQNALSKMFDMVLKTTLLQFVNGKSKLQKASQQKFSSLKVEVTLEKILQITGVCKKKTL